jgi:hypothetical protein
MAKRKRDDAAYWEKRLKKSGLSMDRGTSRRVTYVGTAVVLENIEEENAGKKVRRQGNSTTYVGKLRT